MSNEFFWIPNLGSWIRAIAISLLSIGIIFVSGYAAPLLSFLLGWLPPALAYRLWFGAILVALVAPIVLIAVTHHWSHRLLDQYFPETRLSETEAERTSLLPTLLSWWEGFYGWFVGALSMAIATCLFVLIFTSNSVQVTASYLLNLTAFNTLQWIFSPENLIRLVVAAYLYHLEALMRRRLMAHQDS